MGLSISSLLKRLKQDPPAVDEELVPDVLVSIFALLEVPDLMRAASACSSWRSAYTRLRNQFGHHDNACQTPCFLYTSESAGDKVACIYSLAEKRVYELILPDPPIRARHIIGSSYGWLITVDDMSELHLINPITGEQVVLPSIVTLKEVTPILDSEGVLCGYELRRYKIPSLEIDDDYPSIHACDELRDYIYSKAFVFPDPFTQSYLVVLIHNMERLISFAKPGDREWTLLPSTGKYNDCFYTDGILYATTAIGEIFSFDLTGPTVTGKMILDRMRAYASEIYIVQSPWGDMLQVGRDGIIISDNDGSITITEMDKIFLYKVDIAAKKRVEVEGLNGHALFLGRNQPQCLSVEDYPHLKANCAYLTDDHLLLFWSKDEQRDICVVNLGNNSIEDDIIPQLYSNWPDPIWITPNLSMMPTGLM